jgi:hypothetical protein
MQRMFVIKYYLSFLMNVHMLNTRSYLLTCFAQWTQTDRYGGGNDCGFHRG